MTSRNNVLPQLTMDSTNLMAGESYRGAARQRDSLFQDNSIFLQNKSTNLATFEPPAGSFPKISSSESRRPMKIPELVKMARDLDPDAYAEFRQTKAKLLQQELEQANEKLKTRKESVPHNAIESNKWRAPVKKKHIL